MSKVTNALIGHRVRALATVFLTNRNNLYSCDIDEFGDIDLLARVVSERRTSAHENLFGVILKGTAQPLPTEGDAAAYLNNGARQKKLALAYPFPVLVLLFS